MARGTMGAGVGGKAVEGGKRLLDVLFPLKNYGVGARVARPRLFFSTEPTKTKSKLWSDFTTKSIRQRPRSHVRNLRDRSHV